MSKEIILIGYFSEAVELCEKAGYVIKGVVDRECPDNCTYEYLGDDDFVLGHAELYAGIKLFLVPDYPGLRKHLYEEYSSRGFEFATVISPNAIVSPSAQIEEGCMIQDGCNISSNVKLGKCVRVNSMANIMHDSEVGDFSVVAPSSVVLGRCRIDELAYVGANATILPEKRVGVKSIVGAGAVVTKDVEDGITVVGIPARKIKSK